AGGRARHLPFRRQQGGPFPLASRVTLEGPATVGTATAEIRKLSDLLEVSQTLSSTLNLKSALTRVVPRASHEPLFLDRTGVLKGAGKGEISYICVPITVDDASVGALGVTLH